MTQLCAVGSTTAEYIGSSSSSAEPAELDNDDAADDSDDEPSDVEDCGDDIEGLLEECPTQWELHKDTTPLWFTLLVRSVLQRSTKQG